MDKQRLQELAEELHNNKSAVEDLSDDELRMYLVSNDSEVKSNNQNEPCLKYRYGL